MEDYSYKSQFKIILKALIQLWIITCHRWWEFVRPNLKVVVKVLIILLCTSNTVWYFAYSGNKVIRSDIEAIYQMRVDSIQNLLDINRELAKDYRVKYSLLRDSLKSLPNKKLTRKSYTKSVTKQINDSIN